MAYHHVGDYIVTLDYYGERWIWRVSDPTGQIASGREGAYTDAAEMAHNVIMRACGTEIVWR